MHSMESLFEEKEHDRVYTVGNSAWETDPRKHSDGSPNDHTQRLTYAQAAVFEEARAKAERAALQVRQHRRSSTPPSLPSTATTHSKTASMSSSSTSTSSSPAFSNINEEFPRRPGAFVCLKFIKGLRHPESGCPFDHPNLAAKDFAYCKRLCSFFPANNCDYRLGHKEKRFAKADEPTCDFVHEWAYFNDATGQLVRIRPPLPEDIAAAAEKELRQHEMNNADKMQSMSMNKQRKSQRGRKRRDVHERTSSAERDVHTPTAAGAFINLTSNGKDSNAEIDAELAEHAAATDALASLSLEEHISSSSSSSSCSPSTTVLSIASTSRSSTISPMNLHQSLSGRSPSASSTPCRFSHSHSNDFEALPSVSSMSSASSSSASNTTSIFSFPIPLLHAPVRSTSDLYSSPVDDFDLQDFSTSWMPANTIPVGTNAGNNSTTDGTAARTSANSVGMIENLNGAVARLGGRSNVTAAGIAGYDTACPLTAVPSSGLSPGALWRQLSAEDKEILKGQQLQPRFQNQVQPSNTYLEPPVVLKRPISPPEPLRVPAMYPNKLSSSPVAPGATFYNSAVVAGSIASPPRLSDPFRYLSGEVLHSLKALINSFYPSRPEELDDFFLRLDGLLARHYVASSHPILKQLFLKRFPTQDMFVSEVLHRVKKLEEARSAGEWGKQMHSNAVMETQKNLVMHATAGVQPRIPNSVSQPSYPHVNSHLTTKTNIGMPLLPPQAQPQSQSARLVARAAYPVPVSVPLPVYQPVAPISAPIPLASSSSGQLHGFGNGAMFTPATSQQKQPAGRRHFHGPYSAAPHMQMHASF